MDWVGKSGSPSAPHAEAGARASARREKIASQMAQDAAGEIARLRARADFVEQYSYFLDLLADRPDKRLAAIGKPVAAFLCQVAPLELIEAHGLHPFRLMGGHQAAERLSSPSLPAVMCPMLRSLLGSMMSLDQGPELAGLIMPTMCDWTVKFGSLSELCGLKLPAKLHLMDPPRVKNSPQTSDRWLKETWRLNDFLTAISGRKIGPKELSKAIRVYRQAFMALSDLIDLKRQSKLPQIWFTVITAAFYLDQVQNWTQAARAVWLAVGDQALVGPGSVQTDFKNASAAGVNLGPPDLSGRRNQAKKVFLAGSPIFFPNFKTLLLVEQAGLETVIDDFCSSERLLPGPVAVSDESFYGLMTALSQRYQLGCLCPTFADHYQVVNNITNLFDHPLFQGVIFHVLKGCHLFDLKSLAVEPNVKGLGIKFLRLETDYSREDRDTLLTRLEAFAGTL
ncbi:MAG: 2-hydroxyacyl-CoA dehydratase family protein [Deltaproteobacteria bacterium]|jgi:benzoyl-CoA reductase/2-hydroxyglutaryl-CoA dehydratase subunit BcrC/BadD/HgdB|nr:2-hydroxyacyl-CoA dehydratase family protein [Deltaproteobacteria bacterium]